MDGWVMDEEGAAKECVVVWLCVVVWFVCVGVVVCKRPQATAHTHTVCALVSHVTFSVLC